MSNPELKALRSQVLQQRRKLASHFVLDASRSATDKIISLVEFQNARKIGVYFPFDNEMDPRLILDSAYATGKNVFLPVLSEGKTLKFAPFSPEKKLVVNRFGIPEPECRENKLATAVKLDLLIIPMACFDKDCNRIGMGAGYYDRTLAQATAHMPVKVGLAYEMQRVESTSPQAWDIAMDMVITEQRIYRRHR
ncbi:MAG: 5-formyltetrahydrofolate cyclo-ligase [Gammaproteobacteria bacterium]|nr:5-formyltetrahydrofolate cyclo-ligase [Gammaproteobacteria bacterium]